MLNLQPIFSDHALFLHSSPLTVRGTSDAKNTVNVYLMRDGKTVTSATSDVAENGVFEATLYTPVASYDTYEIKVEDGENEIVLKDILFGELWLASGQSNMEMPNSTQNECEEYLDGLAGKNLRFFWQGRNPGGHTGIYPYEPDYTMNGKWVVMSDREFLRRVSACATAFSNKIYDYFTSTDHEIPVGFVNSSVGGTRLEPWLPRFAFEEDEAITEYLKKLDRYPTEENWNQQGEGNYQQTTCMFNQLISPHLGAKFRGIIWYQGESNCTTEFENRIYAKLLKKLRESYKKLFSASENEVFPILSSMIYPWAYSVSGECNIGYLNKAFSDLNSESPSEYMFIPICDLSPIWAFHIGNHPIHPIHKYPLGERMALMCENAFYYRSVKNVQKRPPMLKSCVRKGNALRLTFSDTGSGLYIKGRKIRGMYVCGKDGVYTPADCEIVNKSTLLVSCRGIEKPVHVAYAISSFEPQTNLYAGEFPVAPFCTQLGDTEKQIKIFLKPWLNMENDSEFIYNFRGEIRDAFRQPIYYPSNGSAICYDSDFSLTGRSLRVSGEGENFGTYFLTKRYNDIDLYNYSALCVSLLNNSGLTARLKVYYSEKADGTALTVTLKAERVKEYSNGWCDYRFDLSALPRSYIAKAEFLFNKKETPLYYVNIDNLYLIEKS